MEPSHHASQELCADIFMLLLSPENSRCPCFPKVPTLSQFRETARLCLGSSWCYCSLETLKAATHKQGSPHLFLLSGISVLCCLWFNGWQLFHIFGFCCYYLKWEDKSRSCYAIKLYFKDNLENLRHRISLVVQWLKLSSQCRGPRINPWSGN